MKTDIRQEPADADQMEAIVNTNLDDVIPQLEKQIKTGKILIVSHPTQPVLKAVVDSLSDTFKHAPKIVEYKDAISYLKNTPADVIVLPATLHDTMVARLRSAAHMFDPSIVFVSYTPISKARVGYEHIRHASISQDDTKSLVDIVKQAGHEVRKKRRIREDDPIAKNLQGFVNEIRTLKSHIFRHVIEPKLPLEPSAGMSAELVEPIARHYERYAQVESEFTDDSKEGIRRLRFFKTNVTDHENQTAILCGIKKLSDEEYNDSLALRTYLREHYPTTLARLPTWFLRAQNNGANYVAFTLFNSIDLRDSILYLSGSNSKNKQCAIDAILHQNLSTLSCLQRPLPADSIETAVSGIKKYYVQKTISALDSMQTHSILPKQPGLTAQILEAFDNYDWLDSAKDIEVAFSILADNSPKNSGLEFAKKPKSPRQLWAYLNANAAHHADRQKAFLQNIANAYRIYEAGSHPGHRFEDVMHILGCEGITLTPHMYAKHRNYFVSQVLKKLKRPELSDTMHGSLVAAGPGLGVYKCIRKQHLITTQYLPKVLARYLNAEISEIEFRAKVLEYTDRRQNWATKALFFAEHWHATKNGEAYSLEKSADGGPPQNAYDVAQQILAKVNIKKIIDFIKERYVAPNYIPFPKK
ncbi:MAG TPA: hypothetical protein VK158_00020 [Acidobacteriota bacterium]|nr:hypothetical protein [Acidobacteriota bacterium]